MSVPILPIEIRYVISKYIPQTPEDWNSFKEIFDENGKLTTLKRDEILNVPIWIEITFSVITNSIVMYDIHTTKPCIIRYRGEWRPMIRCYKTVYIEKKIKDVL